MNNNDVAIFTTYDSSKGLEREICVLFDFNLDYWEMRLKRNDVKYEIIRNIFGVAASRGKSQIIFVEPDKPNYKCKYDNVLIEISQNPNNHNYNYKEHFLISQMFDFMDHFDEFSRTGENHSHISSCEQEQRFTHQFNPRPSLFDSNSILRDNQKVSSIEYAAFYGSIEIFQYLLLIGCELTTSLWKYVIHSLHVVNFILIGIKFVFLS